MQGYELLLKKIGPLGWCGSNFLACNFSYIWYSSTYDLSLSTYIAREKHNNDNKETCRLFSYVNLLFCIYY
jgi:hypothetical protein